MVERPGWDDYFLGIAQAVAARAECTRAQHGCVLVDADHRILSTGYNGTPPGDRRSCESGDCPRGTDRALPGHAEGQHDYANCIALHAEQNAVANSRGVRGSTAYITGEPCDMCAKLLAAAGVVRTVVVRFECDKCGSLMQPPGGRRRSWCWSCAPMPLTRIRS